MKKQTGNQQRYIVLLTIGDQEFFIKYDHINSRYIAVEYNGRHAEKFSLQAADFARHRYMDDLSNDPDHCNATVIPWN